MNHSERIEDAARRMLGAEADAVISYRLLRDVLKRPADDPELVSARRRLHAYPHVKRLAKEQRRDGSWGGLHGGRPALPLTIENTEGGVDLALALGLDGTHPVLRKARDYLAELLDGRRPFPEYEKNDRFPAGWRMFAAAKLAAIDPRHPAADGVFASFKAILICTFASGDYDEAAEERAHRELHGIRSGVGYLGLASKYVVGLLGSRVHELPRAMEKAYVRWLWSRPNLGYLLGRLPQPPTGRTPLWMELWFLSHELASAYPTWKSLAGPVMRWLWKKRTDTGLWDFGPLAGVSAGLPLPQDRRKRGVRQQYCSLRVLMLLWKYEQ